MSLRRKIVNDPVLGFITIPDELTFNVIEHPWFQRLRRISQLGLTGMVYPGALHTRFHHALGAMHLMTGAINILRSKGIPVKDEDASGAILAILLHDIGHGPYSHALENSIVSGHTHEEISTWFMERLNVEFGGQLDSAIAIFRNTHPVKFLHQLVTGQLDMDRMDYLMRDSFYTGVSEGVINTERILTMLTVAGDDLAVESKGIYSIEKFIVARRLMYWQVYYHKTVLAAEYMLVSILRRVKSLVEAGHALKASEPFAYFLENPIGKKEFLTQERTLEYFAELDDYDILSAVKSWVRHPDIILSELCKSLVNRNLYRVIISEEPFEDAFVSKIRETCKQGLKITDIEADFLITKGTISNNAYDPTHHKINIIDKAGVVRDFSEISDQLNIGLYSSLVLKHFICFPKWAE